MAKATKFDEGATPYARRKVGGYLRKITLIMAIIMGIGNSLVMSLTGTLLSKHFTIPMWLRSFAIAFTIAFILANIFPMKVLCDKIDKKLGYVTYDDSKKQDSKQKLIHSVATTLVFVPIVTVILCIVMNNMAIKNMDKARADLTSDIKVLTQQRDAKQMQLDTLLAEHTSLEEEAEETKSQLEELQKTADTSLPEIEEGIASVKTALEEVNTGLDEISSAILEIEESIANAPNENATSGIQASLAELQGQKDGLDAQKQELETTLADLNASKASIEEGLASLSSAVKAQETGLASQEEGIASLSGAITGMNEGIQEQEKARDNITNPSLIKSIILDLLICLFLSVILNYFLMPFALAVTLKIVGKEASSIYETKIEWRK